VGQSPRTSPVASLLVVLALAVIVSLPRQVNIDSKARLDALSDLFSRHVIPDTKYSLIGPLFAAPLWQLGQWAGDPEPAVWWFNRLVVLLGAGAMWWAFRPALGTDETKRFLLLLFFASMVPYHLTYFSGEVFTAVTMAVGTATAILRGKWWGWLIAAIGAANTPGTVPAFAIAVALACWDRRQLRGILAVMFAACLVLLENAIRRGDPFEGGYSDDHGFANAMPYSGQPGFSYPLFFGVLAILFSFGKGLLFFTPGPVRAVRKSKRGERDQRNRFASALPHVDRHRHRARAGVRPLVVVVRRVLLGAAVFSSSRAGRRRSF